MKGLRTIRFDPSDLHVFEHAAEPGEWAVPGGFAFAAASAPGLTGKARQAFANGFLGLSSFGRSTFATVSEMSDPEFAEVLHGLARYFVTRFGAPDADAALPQARTELGFACDLCADAPINTIFTLRRHVDNSGDIREEFRIVQAPTERAHTRIWDVVQDD